MASKGIVGVVAGRAAILTTLVMLIVVCVIGAPALQQKKFVAQRIGAGVAVAKADAIAQALLLNPAGLQPSMTGANGTFSARHLPDVLLHAEAVTGADSFIERAVRTLKSGSGRPVVEFVTRSGSFHFLYAVADGRGGVLSLDIPMERERAVIGRFFGQSHLAGNIISYALIGLILAGGIALRRHLRKLAKLPESERRVAAAAALEEDSGMRHNLLPWTLALCGAVFAVDMADWMDSAIGIGYVLAVTLTLLSNRSWHVIAVAAASTLLLFITPFISHYTIHWWGYLQNHSVVVFAIMATAIFGTATVRKSQAAALAIADATHAKLESQEMRAALARAEHAENERRAIFERLTIANQAAGISVWEWDIAGDRITIAERDSPFVARIGGRNEISGKEYVETVVHPEERAHWMEVFTQLLTGSGDSISHRFRAILPDGSIRHVQFHGRVLRTAKGRALRMLGVDWDVTKEEEAMRDAARQAEQLRDAELRLEHASLSSSEGHWELDFREGRRDAWFSSSYASITGYSPEWLRSLGYEGLVEMTHPDDRSRHDDAVRRHLRTKEPYDVVLRQRVASGEYRWFRVRGTVQQDAHGKSIRAAGSLHDVHQQKLAEDRLLEVQERFRRAVSGTQDALFEINLRSGATWHSPRFMEMLGYDATETTVAGVGVLESIHPDDAPRVKTAMNDHLERGVSYDVEYRLRKRDGDWLWVRSRAAAQHDAVGQPLWFAGSLHDNTEARSAREALIRATEEAEAANKAKGTFLATMSHEIRTPMNGIIGMTGLLLEAGLDRVQRDYAETIRASADSLLTILNDILDFSKIEAGKLDIENIELDLAANVDDVGSIMAFQAAAKGLELIVNVRPEVPERVFGDPQRIRQCLLNLVGNAIKFTHSGEVVVEVCCIGRQSGRALVHFEVRDTGIGINADTLATLFQPFTQADSSTTRKFGGTGLGLSIVRKLIEMMGGQVGAQSEPGRGSTFWFTLPLEPVMAAQEEPPVLTQRLGKRVLLVDDNETNRRVLSSQMMHTGYDVEVAASATRALELLRKPGAAFDVVILDYQMPDMDGAMLGEQIMKARDIVPTRLMLLTSLDRSGDMQRFADIGFSAYLTKPVRARELLECLGKSLAREANEWAMRSQPIITRGTLIANEPKRQYTGKVLLVEDNAINQRVARRFLERLGCDVHVVGDGAQAVDAYQRERWSFILMDMQMPVMDGLEATRRIRDLEGSGDRTPIVALTANAMMGQLERCLEAGMDDYLTKPLDISRLQDVLDRFISGSSSALVEQRTQSAPQAAACEDSVRSRLLDIAGDDAQFAAELIETFVQAGDQILEELRNAARHNDAAAVARAVHKLKGASANLHITNLAMLALDLETRAKAGAVSDWSNDVKMIEAELRRVRRGLQELITELAGKQRKAG